MNVYSLRLSPKFALLLLEYQADGTPKSCFAIGIYEIGPLDAIFMKHTGVQIDPLPATGIVGHCSGVESFYF